MARLFMAVCQSESGSTSQILIAGLHLSLLTEFITLFSDETPKEILQASWNIFQCNYIETTKTGFCGAALSLFCTVDK